MLTSLESRTEKLLLAAREEACLLAAQLEKSRTARGTFRCVSSGARHAASAAAPTVGTSPPSPTREGSASREASAASRFSRGSSAIDVSGRTRSPSAAPPPASPPRVVVLTAATQKKGTLLHLVRSSGLFGGGSRSFVPHYIVVSGGAGISWYASEAEYHQHPSRPLGHANFWIETFNSRGSRFKKAAVCWPLILPGDCPEARDASKTYFAVDYYTPDGAREQMVLAASSPAERDAWVQFLTKYIDLYLAPRAESEELQHIPRGAAVPLHRSGVIEGEAPGGNIL
ncbi:hypothetical protein LSCM4_03054 [Leishmania orientalis]|uniref:PH domain-containing protein n=1 Tax=Leishmania orientalis TaxID=2249476 RepID=A0A836GV07_9TRYP|nr:hypothetical protein LSCM4_03054 [Leishmania orientalis]